MKTNKEKAQDCLDNSISTGNRILTNVIQKLIELASKPNWYYPSRGEFPKKGDRVIIVRKKREGTLKDIYRYAGEFDNTDWINIVIAWTHLPKFKEDEEEI